MTTKRLNLLIILPDQMRLHAMSLWSQPGYAVTGAVPGGGDPVATPHLDALAKESLVLTRAVSNFPLCSPFRAMLMSGRFPHANQVTGNCNSRNAPHGVELPTDLTCWSDILAAQGWRTGYIGKWHLDSPQQPFVDCANNRGEIAWNEWCPPDRRHGFADWYSYGTYDQHMRPMYWDTQATRDGFHYVDTWGPEHEADQAIAFLKQQRDESRPFALVVAMNPPHTSYKEVPQHLLAEQQGRELLMRGNIDHATLDRSKAQPEAEAYFAMVQGVDEQVGRILATLAEEGLADDTLVLFTADHGCCLHSHAQGFKNVPWDESILIPFILRFPGRVAPRIDHDCVLSVPDIMPTVLGLLGYRAEIPADVQGRELSAWCCDGSGMVPTAALYQQIDVADHSAGPRGLRTRDHLFLAQPDGRAQLFDSRSDPYQLHDISAQQPALVGQFHADLRLELERAGDPWPG